MTQQSEPDWKRNFAEYVRAQVDYERSNPRNPKDVIAAIERLEERLIRIEIALKTLPELK